MACDRRKQVFTVKLVESDKWRCVLNLAVEIDSRPMNEKQVEVQQWDGWLDEPHQLNTLTGFCCFFSGSSIVLWFVGVAYFCRCCDSLSQYIGLYCTFPTLQKETQTGAAHIDLLPLSSFI